MTSAIPTGLIEEDSEMLRGLTGFTGLVPAAMPVPGRPADSPSTSAVRLVLLPYGSALTCRDPMRTGRRMAVEAYEDNRKINHGASIRNPGL